MARSGDLPGIGSGFTLTEVLAAMPVSLSQAAEWIGVSRRQLSYWISQGIVPAGERLSPATIQFAALVKAELDHNLPLRQAAAKASAAMRASQALLDFEQAAPVADVAQAVRDRLDGCLAALSGMRAILPELSDDELGNVRVALQQFSRPVPPDDQSVPEGFLLLADRLVEALSTAVPQSLLTPSLTASGAHHDRR